MTIPIVAWHTEHVYFRQLLDLLRGELDVLHTGGEPDYRLMQDIVGYLREYSDRFHHPREDVAFARLARHCPDLKLVLARLEQEHRVIAHAGEGLEKLIEGALGDNVIPRGVIESAASTYLVYYGSHLAKEEEDVLPRAAKMLSEADWAAVRDAVPPGRDPLFGGGAAERFRELRRRIAREQ